MAYVKSATRPWEVSVVYLVLLLTQLLHHVLELLPALPLRLPSISHVRVGMDAVCFVGVLPLWSAKVTAHRSGAVSAD